LHPAAYTPALFTFAPSIPPVWQSLNEKQNTILLFQMLLAGRVTPHASQSSLKSLGWPKDLQLKVSRQHVLYKSTWRAFG